MKPCITTWPDIVPTDDEAKPDASSAMPKIVAALLETVCSRPVERALDRVDAREAAAVEERRRP